MEDEVDDYMSDAVLATCTSQDIRPGLIKNRAQQRQHEIEKKKKESDLKNKLANRPLHEIEAERREEGLKTKIDEQSKGFAMLQKMGYKSGESLGKTGSGRVEPVEITLKTDRTGLGRESVLREIANRRLAARKRYVEENSNVDEFRKRMTQRTQERQDESDLRKSQRACFNLDSEKDIKEPVEKWFWPHQEPPDEEKDEENEEKEEDEDDFEFSASEKLEILTKYLRETHLYCIWCGSVFDDEKDLSDSCPGPTRDDH